MSRIDDRIGTGRAAFLALAFLSAAGVGCSDEDSEVAGPIGNTGGSLANTGGSVATTGGAVATTGGAVTTTGGAVATTGGSVATTGGSVSTTGGSVSTTGGSPAAGGQPSTGGASNGGSPATGGAANGGTQAGSGGASTGGAATGTGGAVASSGGSGTVGNGDCPAKLVGWATTGSGVTGGGDSTPKVVTSFSDLQSAVGGDSAKVVHLSGSVDTNGNFLKIGSNTTLRGVDKNATIVGGFSIGGKSNIIVQNLTVDGYNEGEGGPVDSIQTSGASNIWLDHLNVIDGPDGKMDLTKGTNLVTVSWCKFWYTSKGHGHRLALLFGNSSEACSGDGGKQNHTVHHNWFAELVDQRMPRLLFGKGHIFNNFYNSPGNGYCIGVGSWGSVLVENNYFKDVNSPHKHQDGHPSFIAASGNVYDNTKGSKETGFQYNGENLSSCETALGMPGPWDPPYQYDLDEAESIPELVQRCAGPQ